jgi:hypothetical protein
MNTLHKLLTNLWFILGGAVVLALLAIWADSGLW